MFAHVPGGERLAAWWRRGECARVYAGLRRLYGGGEDETIAYALGWSALVVGRPQLAVAVAQRFGAGQPSRRWAGTGCAGEPLPLPRAAWGRLEAFGLCELGDSFGALARLEEVVQDLPLGLWLEDVSGILLAAQPSEALAQRASHLEHRAEAWVAEAAGTWRSGCQARSGAEELQGIDEEVTGTWIRLGRLAAVIGDLWAAAGDMAFAAAAWERAHERLKEGARTGRLGGERVGGPKPIWWRLLAAYEEAIYAANAEGGDPKAQAACTKALALGWDPLFAHYCDRLAQGSGLAEPGPRLALEGDCSPFAPQPLNLHYHLNADPWAGATDGATAKEGAPPG